MNELTNNLGTIAKSGIKASVVSKNNDTDDCFRRMVGHDGDERTCHNMSGDDESEDSESE